MSVEQKLDMHIEDDRESFNRLFDKLDAVESKIDGGVAKVDAVDRKADALSAKLDAHKSQLDIIRGQWKMVGVIAGSVVGAIVAWLNA